MKLSHIDPRTDGEIHLIQYEKSFAQNAEPKDKVFTIALNIGPDQEVTIDEAKFIFSTNSLLPLFSNQTFSFENAEQIVAWQYNRDFYCIIDHDKEVNCAGFLFFGSFGNMFIKLDDAHQRKLDILRKIFIEEFETLDNIQTDMLQMLLKRLIIITTRLAKEQYTTKEEVSRFDVIRQFNMLVEDHFRTEHQVQFYAGKLNKSPKTISNVFAHFNQKSPLNVIHERIIMEAKRLLYYSDKSAKEIAFELGFEDAGHFSRFFKNSVGLSITEFKKNREERAQATEKKDRFQIG